ncbi:MAG: N-acetylmuramic acid 6-phosphate etherase [Chloroflexota bacterium]
MSNRSSEPRQPSTEASSSVDLGRPGPAEVAAAMLAGQAAALAAVDPALPAIAAAIDAIADRLAGGGRLILIGAGNSGRLALIQSSEMGPTFGLEPGVVVGVLAGSGRTTDPRDPIATDDAAEDDALAGAVAIAELVVGPADAVVGISASGRTPYTLAALETAAERGALTVAVTCAAGEPMERSATLAIHPAVGPEIVAGSTRLAAGTATKTILDILTTGSMIRLGRVHGGRMIDLRAANAKLRERAVRIVVDLTGRTDADARDALGSVDWSARAAVVRLMLGLSASEARTHAAAHRFLADALASGGPASRKSTLNGEPDPSKNSTRPVQSRR